jgi:small conductance mechanosensitive channel
VKDIDMFTTKIITPQNKLVVIPNGAMSNRNITNYTSQGVIKVFHTIGVSYDTNIKQTKDILMAVRRTQKKALETPAPLLEVCELFNSSVNFAVRSACLPKHYWGVYFETLERSKIALDAAGI